MTHHLSGLGAEMEKCIQECLNCYSVCLSQVLECLNKGGKHSEPKHMRLMMDCVEICKVSADFMLRNSLFHTKTCDTCAEVCEACAESCEQLGDQDMKMCAEVCRKCAQECRNMAAK